MNNNWKKEGMVNGIQGTVIFGLILICWVLIIKLSENLGISPGWGILIFFISSIFTMSFSMAKANHELDNKIKERNK